RLKGWFMENVPKALQSMKASYSFRDLGLTAWCRSHGIRPHAAAISLAGKSEIIDAADHGVPQVRKRLFVHEYLRRRGHQQDWVPPKVKRLLTLGETAFRLPVPTCK